MADARRTAAAPSRQQLLGARPPAPPPPAPPVMRTPFDLNANIEGPDAPPYDPAAVAARDEQIRVENRANPVFSFARGLTLGSNLEDPDESPWALSGDAIQNAIPMLKGPALALGAMRGGLKVVNAAGETVDAGTRLLTGLKNRWPRMSRYLGKTENPVALPGASRSPAAALDRLADDIHARTLVEPGTTTYPLTGARETAGESKGFMVGKYSNQSGKTEKIPLEEFTPAHVRAFIEKHAEEYAKPVAAPKPRGTGKRAKVPEPPPPPPAIGTWIEADKVTGQKYVYLDVAQRHPSQRKATMVASSQAQPSSVTRDMTKGDPGVGEWPKAQNAIFDLENVDELPVGNLAEFLASPEFRTRLDEMYAAGEPVMNGKEWWDLAGGPLERVYGPERTKQLAGMLASTSSAAPPVHNLRAATEYLRRLIKGESVIQPDFRIPDTAVGGLKTSMGAVSPGDFNSIGTQMPMEATRAPNLLKVEAGDFENIARDKMNDMFHALMGDKEIGVFDRRYAKIAEKPSAGIFVDSTKDKVPGSMVEPGMKGQVSPYALIENAVRDAAKAKGLPLGAYSAYVWEGIGDTIKRTGKLYGVEHDAAAIPDASQGFGGIFDAMVAEKAKAWGVSVPEFERRLKMGDAELLMAILATPVGLAAYRQWEQQAPTTGSASPPGLQ